VGENILSPTPEITPPSLLIPAT